MNPTPLRRLQTPLAVACAFVLAAASASAASAATSYGYVRTLEGRATHVAGDSGESQALDTGQPLLTGDRIEVAADSRAEILLSDQTIIRLDSTSAVSLDALANSGDRNAPATRLALAHGNVQVVVGDGAAQPPRVDTANASVYFLAPGSYRVSTEDDWTIVVVRDGSAEVRAASGTRQLAGDQAIEVRGDEAAPRLATLDAGPEDALERWGRRLDERAQAAQVNDVDPSLRYAAAPLEGHGSWVSVDGRRAWQPWVANGWRPYWDGSWDYTPSGLTWVSSEPWGWVTYHYGSWDLAPGFGWVWYPGAVYAPAWVYWYWGPSYVGWCPIGYYTRFYSAGLSFDLGFHFGIHGWAGGHWDGFHDWNFVPIDHVRDHHLRQWGERGWDLHHAGRVDTLPRGVITTDTRMVTRERWARPREIATNLERTAVETRPAARLAGGGGALPDLNDFVARRRDISSNLKQIAMPVAQTGSAGQKVDMRTAPRSIATTRDSANPSWRREVVAPGARPGTLSPGGISGKAPDVGLHRDAAPRAVQSGVQVPDANWRGGGRIVEPRVGGSLPGLRSVQPREGVTVPRSQVGGGGNAVRDWRTVTPRTFTPRASGTNPGAVAPQYRYRPQDSGAAPRDAWRHVTPRTIDPGTGVSRESTPIRRIVDSIRRPGGEAGNYRPVAPQPRSYAPSAPGAGAYRPSSPAPRSYAPSAPGAGAYRPSSPAPRSYAPSGGSASGSRPGGSGSVTRSAPAHERSSSQGQGHKPPRH